MPVCGWFVVAQAELLYLITKLLANEMRIYKMLQMPKSAKLDDFDVVVSSRFWFNTAHINRATSGVGFVIEPTKHWISQTVKFKYASTAHLCLCVKMLCK